MFTNSHQKVCLILFTWFLHVPCTGWASTQPKGSTDPPQQAVALLKQLQLARHDTSRIQLLWQLSVCYQKLKKKDSAHVYLQQGLQLAQREKRPLYLGRIYYQLGAFYDHQAAYDQSVDAYKKSIVLLQQANQIPEASRALYTLARIHTGQGKSLAAIEQINKNLAYANQTGFRDWVGGALSLRYEVHKHLNEPRSAYVDLQEILQNAQQTKRPIDLWIAYTYLGEWFDLHHQFAKAERHWAKAVRIGLRLHHPGMMAETYCGYADNLLNQHRKRDAERVLNKAFLETQKDKRISIDHVQQVLARLREQQKRLVEAQALSQQILTYTRKSYPSSVLKTLEILLRIQKKLGNYSQALATFQEIKLLSDSLRDSKKINAISTIEAQLALEKQQKALTLLKKNAAIHTLEIAQGRQQKLIYELVTVGLLLIILLLSWFDWHTRQNLNKLKAQQREIKEQAERLQELNALKDSLFTLIGHDFRSPLLHLKNSLNQLDMSQRTTDRFTRQIERLKRTADSLYTSMDNLLHWTTMQQKGITTQPIEVDLHTLIAETLDLLDPSIEQKQIHVKVAVARATAWADEEQVHIVLRNILHNAIKFTPIGGQIRIDFQQSDQEAQLVITDTGAGMPTTDPQKAASMANRIGTLGETGTGLGLLVCIEFMKRNLGCLEIDSEIGKGTSVRLRFPVAQKSLAIVDLETA